MYFQLYDIQEDVGSPAEVAKTQEIEKLWYDALPEIIQDPSCWVYKATDPDTDQIVGFSMWKAPEQYPVRRYQPSLLQRFITWLHGISSSIYAYLPFAIQALWSPRLGRRYLEERLYRNNLSAANRAKHVSARDKKDGYWKLYLLTIHPDFERKGIGRLLMADGLRMADESNSPVFLTSTETGAGLYEKMGFRRLETVHRTDEVHGDWKEYVYRLERKSMREAAA